LGERIDYLNDPAAPKANSIVPSANVIVVNDQGEILMIRRTDNGNWAVPGGGMDLGESITDAAVRETKEETGITCEITGLVGIYTNPRHVILYTGNREVRQEFSIVFTARPVGGQLRPSSESSEPQWISPAALLELPMHPSMRQRIQHHLDKRPEALPRLSRKHRLNAPGGRQYLRSGPFHKPRHLVIGTVPPADLNKPISRSHVVAIRPGCHVAVQQRIRPQWVSRRELRP
jgi:8-oxo-dGTP pyrophosphatase MutT (NUDIX family)